MSARVALRGRGPARRARQHALPKPLGRWARMARDATLLIDLDGRLLDANPAAVRMYGYSHAELPSLTIRDLRAPQTRHLVSRELAMANQRGVIFETHHLRKDGCVFPVEVSARGIDYEGRRAIVDSVRDITERRRAEEALAARTRQLEAIREVTLEITKELDLPTLLRLVLRDATGMLGVSNGGVALWDDEAQCLIPVACRGFNPWIGKQHIHLGEGLSGAAAAQRRLLRSNAYRDSPYAHPLIVSQTDITAVLSVPLFCRERLLGVLTVGNQGAPERRFGDADAELLHLLACQAAIAIDNARLYTVSRTELAERKRMEQELRTSQERLRALAAHVEELREAERVRIAREVHDELGQALACVKLDLAWLDARLGEERAGLRSKLRETNDLLDATVQRVRRIAAELRPAVLDALGLGAAIEWQAEEYARRTGIQSAVRIAVHAGRLTDGQATAVFRILQEALSNAALHARAAHVSVTLAEAQETLVMEVRDDGRGIRPEEVASGGSLGLIGMRERARTLGGDVQIVGRPDEGTTLTLRVPLRAPDPREMRP